MVILRCQPPDESHPMKELNLRADSGILHFKVPATRPKNLSYVPTVEYSTLKKLNYDALI